MHMGTYIVIVLVLRSTCTLDVHIGAHCRWSRQEGYQSGYQSGPPGAGRRDTSLATSLDTSLALLVQVRRWDTSLATSTEYLPPYRLNSDLIHAE